MSRLPNFLYVGPDKAGSSWLHEMLIKHPDVYLTPAKDLYFFDRYYDRGREWYAAQFRDARGEEVVGEVCQDYLFHPEAAGRIRETLGPTSGSWCRCATRSSGPGRRTSTCASTGSGRTPSPRRSRSRPELLEHGRYATGLDRFLEHYPRENVHVALFDDLARDPQGFLDAVTDFLGVDPLPLSEQGPGGQAAGGQGPLGPPRPRRPGARADWVREHDGARLVGRVKRSAAGPPGALPPDRQAGGAPGRRRRRHGADASWPRRSRPSKAPSASALREAWGW